MDEKEKNRIIFEQMSVPKALAQMAIPVIISQLVILIYNMADTFYLGRTNNPMMVAGASLILPLYNVCIAVANIAGTGGGTLIARLLGLGRTEDARKVSSFSFYFAILGAVFFAVVTIAFIRPLLTLLGASSETFEYAKQYAMCVIVFGAVPTIMGITLANLLRNSGKSKIAGFGTSMGGILNIILDPIFMFVILPEGKETLGAGIATALSNVIVCTFFIIVIIRMKSEILSLSPRNKLPDKEEIKSFFSVGIPAALGPFLFDIDYMVLDKLAASYSDIALAAIGIVLKVERFPLNVGIGLCLGMVPLAAYNYSSGNHDRMKETVKVTRNTGFLVAVISIALYEIYAPSILKIFIADASTVEIGTKFLRIRALATIMMFGSFIYVHFFQAVGKGTISLALTVLRWLVFNIPMLFILNKLMGMYGIVWSQFICDTCVAIISFVVYLRFMKKYNNKNITEGGKLI